MKLYALTRDEEPFTVRRLLPELLPAACDLAWQVFCRFEVPEYSQEGIDEFKKTLENMEALRHMPFYGAFHGGELVGVLAMRQVQHISLFFVKEAWHRQGVGRLLFDAMRRDYTDQVFTVNSSPYAVEVYRHLGFVPTDTEQLTNGIRYTPDMVLGADRKGIKLTYCTDSRPVAAIADHAKNSDLFICEGMYGELDKVDQAKGYKHRTFYAAAQMARNANPRELWLTHYSPSLTHDEDYMKDVRKIFPAAYPGKDGKTVDLCFEEE